MAQFTRLGSIPPDDPIYKLGTQVICPLISINSISNGLTEENMPDITENLVVSTLPSSPLNNIGGFSIVAQGQMAPSVAHVQVTDAHGSPIALRSLIYYWDFGNHGAAYNNLPGWNAAHIYDSPGDYKITLTVSNGTQSKSFSKTITIVANTRVIKTLTPADIATFVPQNDHHYMFQHGQTYNVTKSIPCNVTNVVFGHAGTGPLPVIVCNPSNGSSAFAMPIAQQTANNILFRGLRFTAPPSLSLKQDAPNVRSGKWMGWLSGSLLTVADCEFDVCYNGMASWPGSSCILLKDNKQIDQNHICAHFIWGEAKNFVALGNVGIGSVDENVFRIADQGVQFGLVYSNQMSRPNAEKYPWTVRTADGILFQNNTSSRAAWGIEPREATHSVRNCSWCNNKLINSFFSVRPGVYDCDINGNDIDITGPAITLLLHNSGAPTMEIHGILFNNNRCRLYGRPMTAFYGGNPTPQQFEASGNTIV